MNRRDDCADPLFATDFCEKVRSHVYRRLSKDSLRAKEQAKARQHSCIIRTTNTDYALTSQHCRIALILILATALNACAFIMPATIKPDTASNSSVTAPDIIGPYPKFSGRLIVIQPSKRWQVAIDWQAQEASKGQLRLSHALTGTVIDFRWNNANMEIRDNKFPYWRPIQSDELIEQGLVLPPKQLASILLGKIPSHYIEKKIGTWESKASGSLIRLRWQADKHTLTISDIVHGRVAKLIIQ